MNAENGEETRALPQRRVAGFALALGSLDALALGGRLVQPDGRTTSP